ncbi:MAG: sugar phosphate isomerase/epimerase family protein [Gemmatimonadaceae bacterium]
MIDRRDFLRTLGASALGAVGVAESACAPRSVASGTSRIERIGVQLYTLRNELGKDFDGTLARVAEIGFKEVEFAGYYDRSPADVRATLDKHGLTAPSAHVGTAANVVTGWAQTIENAKLIGHEYLGVAYLTVEERKTLDDYRKLADIFNRAGETARKLGVQFAYHNHDFEFVPIDGAVPYDILLDRTDPALVKMEMDLFWITKAGHKPLEYFSRYPGRFPLVHVKDMDARERMVDVGRGAIDFKGIFALREQAGIRHFFVEHDEPKPDGLASVKSSYDHLLQLRF